MNPDHDLAKIQATLDSQAKQPNQTTATSSDGRVRVTVDQRLHVTAVEFLDKSIHSDTKVALGNATAEAVNDALLKAVLAASEALAQLKPRLDLENLQSGGADSRVREGD